MGNFTAYVYYCCNFWFDVLILNAINQSIIIFKCGMHDVMLAYSNKIIEIIRSVFNI